ncbi:MAG: ATP-binding protein [Trebonia sp.]|jgi:signal transduction histidine kinase/CheY-like chemotaxis protein
MRAPPAAVPRPGRVQRWWLDRSLRAKGLMVLAVPLIALIGVSSASLALQYNERQERAVSTTASAVITSAQQVLADAVNAETGVRGYAATGQALFLQPYNASVARFAGDQTALRAAAVAEGDSRAERTVAATATTEMAELARLRTAISTGAPDTALRPGLKNGKTTMDTLRTQIASLVRGPTATHTSGHAAITRMESTIGWVSIAGLALGVLAGLIGMALFGSGISRRVARAAANAGRLGEGRPLEPVPWPAAGDELGRLARSLTHAESLLARRSTELISARDQAVKATRAKNAFLSSTSHELRTPLNSVLGFAQLLQLSDLSQDDEDGVKRILVAGHHLLALINELIDIARIESGGFSVSVEPVAVQPVVEETCQLMAPLAADRSITIGRPCPPPGLAVKADRQRLRQILVNLLSNAIKYNRAGGAVTITCQSDSPDQASLTVADTGPGILAADLDRVFDPFERLGAEQTAVEGTGIGLPLARAFAEAMHGNLSAASVSGEGSAFTITLPRAPDLVQALPDDQGIPLPRIALDDSAGESIHVLYIEDNPANIEVVTRFLKTRPGMRLRSVTSGQAGLESATRDIPDLILLDLHLPGLHGDEVLRRLRDKPATAGVPVAILSAEASPAIIHQMRGRGIVAYLTKPVDLDELGRLLDSVAAGHDRPAGPASRAAPVP